MSLAAVLAVAGCAARRPAGSVLHTDEPASAPAATSCAPGHEQIEPANDGAELALEVASAVVVAGILATAIVLGARTGGLTMPTLHLGSTDVGCPPAAEGSTCSDDEPGCIAVASTTTPG